MGHIFAVTSGKGGVGKSTVSVGLAFAFAASGHRTLLVDMDEGLRCLDIMLGTDVSAVFDLSDVLMGREMRDAVYPVENRENLFLVPAPAEVGRIDAFAFSGFVKEAAAEFDTVIFDFPAGIDFSLYTCLPPEALFITVAVPEPVSVRDAAVVSKKLGEISRPSRLIINNFEYRLTRRGLSRGIDDVIDGAGLRLLGIIPASDELALLSVTHRLKRNGRAMRAFKRTAERLCGESVLLPKPKKI